MKFVVSKSKEQMGERAAKLGAQRIGDAVKAEGEAAVILATGMSQFTMLEALVAEPDVDWSRVTAFHLDEYIGIDEHHPASFRRYLRERFASKVPSLAAFHYVRGDAAEPAAECRRLNDLISAKTIAVAFVGIGENGHLAFNDPPADFQTEDPFIVVDLDEACRKQQLGEGWFPTLGDVPRRAISMSIRRIMASRTIVCTVPDRRKAEAVKCTVDGPVSPDCPASIMQRHPDCALFLDEPAASLLSEETLKRYS